MAKTKIRNGLIAALDVGTTKVACFIARAQDDGSLRVLGIGHQLSRGIKNGAVIDMDEAEGAIRASVEAAETMAGERIREVVVNISGGQPISANVKVEASINGHPVADGDLKRMLDHGRQHSAVPERDLLHAIPIDFAIDETTGVRDPRGMVGEKLAMTVHTVTAGIAPVRNLTTVVHRCLLDIEAKVVSPLASGLACLVDDERDLGVTLIDMGGGTTSIAVFLRGSLIHAEVLPVGGLHVTNDIARGLSTTVSHAERMKTLHGSCLPSPSDDREILKVPLVGEEDDGLSNQVPRSMLVQIIQPRIEETFELVRQHLNASAAGKIAGRRVVLVGGASQLQGCRDLAAMVLDKQVRLGKPVGLHGLPEAVNGPAFATCAGLLRFGATVQSEKPDRNRKSNRGTFGRIGQWIRNNF